MATISFSRKQAKWRVVASASLSKGHGMLLSLLRKTRDRNGKVSAAVISAKRIARI